MDNIQYLSKAEALGSCLMFAVFFVGSLYLFGKKNAQFLTRNHPEVIKQRFLSILIVCIFSPIFIWMLLSVHGFFKKDSQTSLFFKMLGITNTNVLLGPLSSIALICEIYFGPLVVMFLQKELFFQNQNYKYLDFSILEVRNYIVGPISEEFIFRSCMCAVCFAANFSNTVMIFLLPMFFGLAHIHHAYEYYKMNKATENVIQQIIISTVFQFSYTTVFGWFSLFLFLKTGNILSPIVAHILCNILDFPDVNSVIQATKKNKLIYIVCYLLGLIVFCVHMYFFSTSNGMKSVFWK